MNVCQACLRGGRTRHEEEGKESIATHSTSTRRKEQVGNKKNSFKGKKRSEARHEGGEKGGSKGMGGMA